MVCVYIYILVDVDTLGVGWQQMDTEKEDLYTYEGRRIMVLYVLSENYSFGHCS
jgi:hypothetical protein